MIWIIVFRNSEKIPKRPEKGGVAMENYFPLLFGLLSTLVFLMTSALVYLIFKPAERVSRASAGVHSDDRNFHAP